MKYTETKRIPNTTYPGTIGLLIDKNTADVTQTPGATGTTPADFCQANSGAFCELAVCHTWTYETWNSNVWNSNNKNYELAVMFTYRIDDDSCSSNAKQKFAADLYDLKNWADIYDRNNKQLRWNFTGVSGNPPMATKTKQTAIMMIPANSLTKRADGTYNLRFFYDLGAGDLRCSVQILEPEIYSCKNGGCATSVTTYAMDNTNSISFKAPVRSMYTFDGWYTASTGGTRVVDPSGNITPNVSGWTDSSGKFMVTTSNKTLYAHWTEKSI